MGRDQSSRKCRSGLKFLLNKKHPVLPENYCETGRIVKASASNNYFNYLEIRAKLSGSYVGMGFDNTRAVVTWQDVIRGSTLGDSMIFSLAAR
jgi:hypothetical protein